MTKEEWKETKTYYNKHYKGMMIKTILGLLFLIISLVLMFA